MATFQVTNASDAGPGSLRQAILDANLAGGADTITFDPTLAGQTITLADDLAQIAGDLTIEGSDVTIDGADIYRVFWASSGAIAIRDLVIANGLARGGDGGDGFTPGGGGAGLGGGLFVDEDADVTLQGVTFAANRAEGGGIGAVVPPFSYGGGGGGGMDADGFESTGLEDGGRGGGPAGGAGGVSGTPGQDGGDFSGGGGGQGSAALGAPAGAGGFGGGGGGYGRLGGGNATSGNGGFGGGAGPYGDPGYGGGAGGSANRDSGGGAGLGGAVFVRAGGSLTLEDVDFGSDNAVVGGHGSDDLDTDDDGAAEGAGLFLMGGGTLAYSVTTGQTRTVGASIESDGAGMSLSKSGAGILVLGGAHDLQALQVTAGTLHVNGALATSVVTVQSGGALGGAGAVGAVTVQSGGTLAPGASPGTLSTGDLSLASGATFEAELGGAGVGQFDRVNVTGAVSLGGATLDLVLFGGFTPAAGNSFLLIDNDMADAVNGEFAGFVDGVAVTRGGLRYTVDYQGGDGNDVVLTISAVSAPPPPAPRPIPSVGGAGRDVAILDRNPTTYSAGDGDDLAMGDGGNDTVHGNLGADTLYGGSGDDIVRGGQGSDAVYGDDGADRLFGDKADDFVHGGRGNDVIEGGEGSDALAGGQGDDSLSGGDGADILSGDRGADTLSGGAGADVFRFFAGGGSDIVVDFDPLEDRLQVSSAYTLGQHGADVVVDLGAGDAITLQNLQFASLPSGWILG